VFPLIQRHALRLIDNKPDAAQPQVAIGGPARPDASFLHHVNSHSVSQGQILVGEPAEYESRAPLLSRVYRDNMERRHHFDQRQKLQSANPIVSSEKPPMALGDHERCAYQSWWRPEQSAEESVVCIRAIGERDEGRRVDVSLSLCGRRSPHRFADSIARRPSQPFRRIASRVGPGRRV